MERELLPVKHPVERSLRQFFHDERALIGPGLDIEIEVMPENGDIPSTVYVLFYGETHDRLIGCFCRTFPNYIISLASAVHATRGPYLAITLIEEGV